MALRLLPAIIMDNDDDDDGNFTNWMSSYWGHGAEGGHSKDRKRSFRRPARSKSDRRASLPSMAQLDTMDLSRLHAAAMAPAPVHLKSREEKEVRPHPRARRVVSEDNNHQAVIPENHIATIPELTESFQRRLHFHTNKKVMSLNDTDNLCLICHGEVSTDGEGVLRELHCTHRFHKEGVRKLLHGRPRSGSAAAECDRRKTTDARSRTGDGPLCEEQEVYCKPRRLLSLRRHR